MKRRVLLVEDNRANMDLASYLVRAYGWLCDTASDGESAVLQAKASKPDIVLCDLQLPGMDGFGVLECLRADPALASIPVVAVTAFAMVGDRDRVLAAGFDGYIPKPLDPLRFMGQIASIAGWPAPSLEG